MEEALIKRVMPHDEEAESSVIGAMLIDNEAIMVASELITGEDVVETLQVPPGSVRIVRELAVGGAEEPTG